MSKSWLTVLRNSLALMMMALVAVVIIPRTSAASTKHHYKVYLDMSYSGNTWQTLAENDIKALAATPPYNKMLSFKVIISGTNVQRQISDLQNMIASGADAILVYPLNPVALNRVIERGCRQGVLFFMYDSTVTAPCAYNVSMIPANYGVNTAQWMVNQLKGKGTIFLNYGVAGTAVTKHYDAGAKHVFNKYPNIKIVSTYYGNWSDSVSERKTSQALAAHPNVDGIWTVDGEWGTLQAVRRCHCVLKEGRKTPFVITGQSNNGFRLAIANQKLRKKGLDGLSSSSGPSVGGYAFKLMMEVLRGERNLKFQNIQYPLPWVTGKNVKICNGSKFVNGCNAFPAGKVPKLFIDTALNSKLLPEIDLKAARRGRPQPGVHIQELPKPIKAGNMPGINCSHCKVASDRFTPTKVKPIAVSR